MNNLLTFASFLAAVLVPLSFTASPGTAQANGCSVPYAGYRWYPAGVYAGRHYPAGWYSYYSGFWYLYGYGHFSGYPIAPVPSPPTDDSPKENTVSIASFPDSRLDLEFAHHNRFKLAILEDKYLIQPRSVAILVEQELIRDRSPKSLRPGEMPIIYISIVDKWHLNHSMYVFSRDTKKYNIANHTVYEFPGFPGPHGEFGYYFLVRLEDQQYLEIVANRYYSADTSRKTNYEKDIRQIIKTLKINKVPPPPK